MSARKVQCLKLQCESEGLEALPFQGELGQKIFDSISKEAWALWEDDMMIKIINEYRLNLSEEKDYNTLLEQMSAFLNLSGAGDSVLEVENAERGKK